jgi:hypothetical protein
MQTATSRDCFKIKYTCFTSHIDHNEAPRHHKEITVKAPSKHLANSFDKQHIVIFS